MAGKMWSVIADNKAVACYNTHYNFTTRIITDMKKIYFAPDNNIYINKYGDKNK